MTRGPRRERYRYTSRSASEVDACADALRAVGIEITHPPIDQPWSHRTLFFRHPDGNVLEIYADI
jgi:uncharacterized glyoxalase superfamily protein PhnB